MGAPHRGQATLVTTDERQCGSHRTPPQPRRQRFQPQARPVDAYAEAGFARFRVAELQGEVELLAVEQLQALREMPSVSSATTR